MRLNLYGAWTLKGVLKLFQTSDKQISTLNQTWPNSNLNLIYLPTVLQGELLNELYFIPFKIPSKNVW